MWGMISVTKGRMFGVRYRHRKLTNVDKVWGGIRGVCISARNLDFKLAFKMIRYHEKRDFSKKFRLILDYHYQM